MNKQKHLTNTRAKVLEVASKLFIMKGFDNTSIQDILTEVDLSKGAIYHHFKSKEEILYAVLNMENEKAHLHLDELIAQLNGNTAKEKIKNLLKLIAQDENINNVNGFLNNKKDNGRIIVELLVQTINNDAEVFHKLILEGVEDGSFFTQYPRESAELLLLLCNIWLNPILFDRTYEDTTNRLQFIRFTMAQLGVDVIDEEMFEIISKNTKRNDIK
ncbi:TetR/AcrR family transcriptional regulator [Bacillus sp. JCM 19041]|uniref:TetR/AcrR family transcriptional regulator n=1 Tax=Bacillus sp. JCM 19041 TaxID=1460637 RepID=UPI0006CF9A2F